MRKKRKLWQNSNTNCEKPQKLKFWQNSKGPILTKLKNWICEKTQKLKLLQDQNCEKKKSKCDETQKLNLWHKGHQKCIINFKVTAILMMLFAFLSSLWTSYYSFTKKVHRRWCRVTDLVPGRHCRGTNGVPVRWCRGTGLAWGVQPRNTCTHLCFRQTVQDILIISLTLKTEKNMKFIHITLPLRPLLRNIKSSVGIVYAMV